MNPFKTFFIGGYECADIVNNRGNRVDLLKMTGHDTHVLEDYKRLAAAGIRTVREGIRWSVVEATPGVYDFTEVRNRLVAAQETGIQQLWDICHFGYPDGLMPTHPQFAERLTSVCEAFTRLYRQHTEDPLIITPINEISFLSWLSGEARGTIPFATHSGFDQKYFLCRAMIRAVEAIKRIDPAALVMMVEPLVRVHPRPGEETNDAITGFNEAQFQAMDIITGKMCPELGGRPEYLDLAGFNYYYNNQWEDRGAVYGWCTARRRMSFTELLSDAWKRYGIPVVLSETGHFGEDRAAWMELITEDCIAALRQGVPLRGICIYPVLDRPDWDFPQKLIPCGIWSYNSLKERSTEEDYLARVEACHFR
ncbi:MAG TPA: amine oxidase, partial [Chitinophagaceae bacterium]|nr:amine oxidase [Chitinophagaceae bacterium]